MIINFNTNNNGYTSINSNSKQYKAAAKDFLADYRVAVVAMTPEQRMMYELFGGEEAHMKNVMRNADTVETAPLEKMIGVSVDCSV